MEGGEIGFGVLFKRLVKRPKTSMDETPRPEVDETPRPEVDETPKPEVNETPKPEVNETPKPEIEAKKADETAESTETAEEGKEKETAQATETPEVAVKDEEKSRVVEKPVIDTVVAIRRVDPSKEDIRGYFECKEEGCLEFGFDNSFSYFRTKIVELNLSVVEE